MRKLTAYGLIFDNLNSIRTVAELRAHTAMNALIYDQLGVSDSWLLTNQRLQEMLLAPDGVELLRSGLIIPIVRADLGSLSARNQQVRANPKSLFDYHDNPALVELVDRHGKAIAYDPSAVGANYRRLSGLVLEPEALGLIGLSEVAVATIRRLYDSEEESRRHTNSFLKDSVQPALPEADREPFWDIVRAVYSLNLPTLLGQGVAATGSFQGHEMLRKVLGVTPEIGGLSIGASQSGRYSLTINDQLVSWLVSQETLASITAAEIAELRSAPYRLEAQLALNAYLGLPDQNNWQAVSGKFEYFLRAAAIQLFQSRNAQGLVKSDPDTSDQTVLRGEAHQVSVSVDQDIPIALSDLPVSGKSIHEVQLVGRTSSLLPSNPTK